MAVGTIRWNILFRGQSINIKITVKMSIPESREPRQSVHSQKQKLSCQKVSGPTCTELWNLIKKLTTTRGMLNEERSC